MRVRDEGRSNAAHWYSEAQRLAEENMRLREALEEAIDGHEHLTTEQFRRMEALVSPPNPALSRPPTAPDQRDKPSGSA